MAVPLRASRRRRGVARRQRWIALAVVLVAAGVAAAVALLGPEGEEPAAGRPYDAVRVAELEARASAGFAHVVYQRSPGGVEATAKRVMAHRPRIEAAVAGTAIPADLVEAIVFLESAGRPDVIAGGSQDPSAAAGLTQIVASTATDFLEMQVDLEESRRLTAEIAAARERGQRERVSRLTAQRRQVDDRFDPDKALRGTVRYLLEAERRLGRLDLAVTSYHMGIGNLSRAIRAYAGAGADVDVAALVRQEDVSYARLYFGTSPVVGAAAWRALTELEDDSSNYYWKLLASQEILRLARTQPDRLAELAALHGTGPTAAGVLHPEGNVGEGPPRLETRATVDWIQRVVARIEPERRPLQVIGQAGWVAEIRRDYDSDGQARAFQHALDRLTALNLISWERREDRVRIIASREASVLLPPGERPSP
jgi:hypothetical protein